MESKKKNISERIGLYFGGIWGEVEFILGIWGSIKGKILSRSCGFFFRELVKSMHHF